AVGTGTKWMNQLPHATAIPTVVGACLLLLLVGMTVRTIMRNLDWVSNESFARSLVRTLPSNAKGHMMLAYVLETERDSSKRDEALSHYLSAVTLYPAFAKGDAAFANRVGDYALLRGHTTDAITLFEIARTAAPDSAAVLYNLAMAYAKGGRLHDAEEA